MSFDIFTPIAIIGLWLGLRCPFRRAILVSVMIGLVADALVDLLVTRPLNSAWRRIADSGTGKRD